IRRALKRQAQGLHAAVGLNTGVRNYSAPKATEMADHVVKALENSKETDGDRISGLGQALAALAARIEPKASASVVAASGAQVLVKALENWKETPGYGDPVSRLGQALEALAGRMEPKEAASVAERVVTALENSKQTYGLSPLGEALAALAGRM